MSVGTLALWLALCGTPMAASADSHSGGQLRLSVENRVTSTSRDLPYAALDRPGISDQHLLAVHFDGTRSRSTSGSRRYSAAMV